MKNPFPKSVHLLSFLAILSLFFGMVAISGEAAAPNTLESRLRELAERAQRLGVALPSESSGVASPSGLGGAPSSPYPYMPSLAVEEAPPSPPSGRREFGDSSVRASPTGSAKNALGGYYVLPFGGFSFPSTLTFHSLSGDEWEFGTETGHVFGLIGGRHYGNWFGELHFDLGRSDFDSMKHPTPSPRPSVSGESEIINVGVRFGYLHGLSTNAWFQLGLGIGYAGREDSLTTVFGLTPNTRKETESTFSYDGALNLGFAFSESFHGRLGYRYLATGKNGDFGPLRKHMIELGLGADF